MKPARFQKVNLCKTDATPFKKGIEKQHSLPFVGWLQHHVAMASHPPALKQVPDLFSIGIYLFLESH